MQKSLHWTNNSTPIREINYRFFFSPFFLQCGNSEILGLNFDPFEFLEKENLRKKLIKIPKLVSRGGLCLLLFLEMSSGGNPLSFRMYPGPVPAFLSAWALEQLLHLSHHKLWGFFHLTGVWEFFFFFPFCFQPLHHLLLCSKPPVWNFGVMSWAGSVGRDSTSIECHGTITLHVSCQWQCDTAWRD